MTGSTRLIRPEKKQSLSLRPSRSGKPSRLLDLHSRGDTPSFGFADEGYDGFALELGVGVCNYGDDCGVEIVTSSLPPHEQRILASAAAEFGNSVAVPDAEPLALAVRLLEDMAGGGDAPHATVGGVVNKAGTPHALRFDSDDLGCDLVDMLICWLHSLMSTGGSAAGTLRTFEPVWPSQGMAVDSSAARG